jgi:hypothetical protein
MIENGNYENLLKLPWEEFVKSHHVNFIFGGFGLFGTTVRHRYDREERCLA